MTISPSFVAEQSATAVNRLNPRKINRFMVHSELRRIWYSAKRNVCDFISGPHVHLYYFFSPLLFIKMPPFHLYGAQAKWKQTHTETGKVAFSARGRRVSQWSAFIHNNGSMLCRACIYTRKLGKGPVAMQHMESLDTWKEGSFFFSGFVHFFIIPFLQTWA